MRRRQFGDPPPSPYNVQSDVPVGTAPPMAERLSRESFEGYRRDIAEYPHGIVTVLACDLAVLLDAYEAQRPRPASEAPDDRYANHPWVDPFPPAPERDDG